MKSKSNIYNIGIIVILTTLIFVRFFSTDATNWINAVNFGGVITAFLSLYFNIFDECKEYKKIDMLTGISVIIFCALIIVEILIVLEIISVSTMWNDVITLLALLVSLPSKLYKRILAKLLK